MQNVLKSIVTRENVRKLIIGNNMLYHLASYLIVVNSSAQQLSLLFHTALTYLIECFELEVFFKKDASKFY